MITKRVPYRGKPLQMTPYAAVMTEGGRLGLMTCLHCGAVVMTGENEADGPGLHEQWHERQESR